MTRARELAKLGNPNVIAVDGSNQVGINSESPKTQLNVVGVVSATSFSGSGANLTNMDTDSLWLQNSEFSSISTTASVGVGTTASATLAFNKDNPVNLFYNIEKSGYISTADTDVENYSHINYIDSDYTGTYSVFDIAVGVTTEFTVSLPKIPQSLTCVPTKTDIAIVLNVKVDKSPELRNSAAATKAEALPPKPLNIATI